MFIADQISKKIERKALREQSEEQKLQAQSGKQFDEEDFEKERHITWEEGEYLKTYFQRERHILENISSGKIRQNLHTFSGQQLKQFRCLSYLSLHYL